MVLVSHLYKFIYLKNSKVAGSSVESFFGQFCVDPAEKASYSFTDKQEAKVTKFGILGSRQVGVEGQTWYNHKSAKEIRRDLGTTLFYKYFKFCVVRNPYDMMVSEYFYNKNPVETFKEFCRRQATTKSANLTKIFLDGKPACNFYIRYEHLQEDIEKVLHLLGITDYNLLNLPNHKSEFRSANKRDYKPMYDAETLAIVQKIYKEELAFFKYTF